MAKHVFQQCLFQVLLVAAMLLVAYMTVLY